jgi:hypothetical protein
MRNGRLWAVMVGVLWGFQGLGWAQGITRPVTHKSVFTPAEARLTLLDRNTIDLAGRVPVVSRVTLLAGGSFQAEVQLDLNNLTGVLRSPSGQVLGAGQFSGLYRFSFETTKQPPWNGVTDPGYLGLFARPADLNQSICMRPVALPSVTPFVWRAPNGRATTSDLRLEVWYAVDAGGNGSALAINLNSSKSNIY